LKGLSFFCEHIVTGFDLDTTIFRYKVIHIIPINIIWIWLSYILKRRNPCSQSFSTGLICGNFCPRSYRTICDRHTLDSVCTTKQKSFRRHRATNITTAGVWITKVYWATGNRFFPFDINNYLPSKLHARYFTLQAHGGFIWYSKRSKQISPTVSQYLSLSNLTIWITCYLGKAPSEWGIYRIIHKSLRDFRPLRYSSWDGHAEGENVNRGTDIPSFCPTLLVLDMSTLGVCLGCCAAEFGSSGRTYVLPCINAKIRTGVESQLQCTIYF
jgi:hypothetical protein